MPFFINGHKFKTDSANVTLKNQSDDILMPKLCHFADMSSFWLIYNEI